MIEFKFDLEHVDEQVMRITQKLAPLLADEHPGHVTAALTVMLASYITVMSSEADIEAAEVDVMVDKMSAKVRRTVHLQRAHYDQFSHPGNA
jgi:hypothetical protein